MKNIFAAWFCLLVMGCSTGPCAREEKMNRDTPPKGETVKVYKPDGTLQCEPPAKGKSLEDMAKDLGPLKIFSQEKAHDGKMRIQMCGTPTGQCNVYEIAVEDLAKAQTVGFKAWPPQ